MTISEQLFTQLSGAAVAGGRIYPLASPQPPVYPYVTYQRVASEVQNVLAGNGTPPINHTRVQIDCYDRTYLGACAIADAVVAAMQAWSVQNTLATDAEDLFEDAIRAYRIVLDFSVWHP